MKATLEYGSLGEPGCVRDPKLDRLPVSRCPFYRSPSGQVVPSSRVGCPYHGRANPAGLLRTQNICSVQHRGFILMINIVKSIGTRLQINEIIRVDGSLCIGCGISIRTCLGGLITKGDQTPVPTEGSWDLCIDCGHCVAVCPTEALHQRRMGPEECTPIDIQLVPTWEQTKQISPMNFNHGLCVSMLFLPWHEIPTRF